VKFAGDQVRVGITGEEKDLEEKHAGRPDTGASAEPRENVFGDQRLDLEQEESAEENGESVGGGQSVSIECSVFSIQSRGKEERRF
jgi:hypothetical protein